MSETQPQSIMIAGQSLKCTHCGHDTFQQANVRLNHRWTSFFDVEWMGKWGTAYICSNCGLKQEFYDAKKFGRGYYRIGLWVIGVIILFYIILVIVAPGQ